MADKEWVTNASWGYCERDGFNRCSCGNNKIAISCHTYKDGTKGYIAGCWECGQHIEVDGTEEMLRETWNKYNAGRVKMTFRITKVPEEVVIYARPDDDISELLKQAMVEQIGVEQIYAKMS